MKKILLIGEHGVGRRSLVRALTGADAVPTASMAMAYCGPFVLSPAAFLENRRFYSALITTAQECDVVVLVQDATRRSSLFPPAFAAMFTRHTAGIISKTDAREADESRARRFLHSAGIREYYAVSLPQGTGLSALRAALWEN